MTLARAFPLIVLIEIFVMGVRPTIDPDMWWHLRMGEEIVTQGIPHHDIFSFTAAGHEIVAHEWGSQSLLWLAYSLGGLKAAACVFALLPAIAFGLLYLACAGRPYLAGAVVGLAAFTASPWFGVKPQLFNLVFLASFVLVLARARRTRRLLLLLPVLTIAWANLHSGYLAGIALLLVCAAGDAVDLALGRPPLFARDRRDVQLLAAIAVACAAAALLNPNGTRLIGYAVDTLRTPAFRTYIAEWRPSDLTRPAYWPFASMLVLTGVVLAFSPTWPTVTEALLAIGGAGAALASARHVPLFTIVATPVVARHARMVLERASRSRVGAAVLAPSTRSGRFGAVTLAGALLIAPLWSAAKLRDNAAIVAGAYPVGAVDFLAAAGISSEHGYNAYDWGGYLIWRGIPVFIDGRADVYGAPFFEYHLKTALAAADWSKPLDEQGCKWALVKRDGPEAGVLGVTASWCERYADAIARVFVRCDAVVDESRHDAHADSR